MHAFHFFSAEVKVEFWNEISVFMRHKFIYYHSPSLSSNVSMQKERAQRLIFLFSLSSRPYNLQDTNDVFT